MPDNFWIGRCYASCAAVRLLNSFNLPVIFSVAILSTSFATTAEAVFSRASKSDSSRIDRITSYNFKSLTAPTCWRTGWQDTKEPATTPTSVHANRLIHQNVCQKLTFYSKNGPMNDSNPKKAKVNARMSRKIFLQLNSNIWSSTAVAQPRWPSPHRSRARGQRLRHRSWALRAFGHDSADVWTDDTDDSDITSSRNSNEIHQVHAEGDTLLRADEARNGRDNW